MKLFRTRFELQSASLTPWQADTLFGHLCWHLARQGGAVLRDFLARYEAGDPPVLLSDGFPGAYLPMPNLPRASVAPLAHKADRVAARRQQKAGTRRAWLTLSDFNRVCQGEAPAQPLRADELTGRWSERLQAKNQINRLTGTTGGEEGQLYEVKELCFGAVTVYWKIADEWESTVQGFLRDLMYSGFGKRKSVGYGQLHSTPELEPFAPGFVASPTANGFVTLSRFVPAPSDPLDGQWNTVVKYGKLGEEFATAGAPFKKPLMQLACGATFRCASEPAPRQWYGCLLDAVAEDEAIRHYAFAFALPLKMG